MNIQTQISQLAAARLQEQFRVLHKSAPGLEALFLDIEETVKQSIKDSTLFKKLESSESLFRDVLDQMARQKTSSELSADQDEGSDYQGGYDTCIDLARSALKEAST